MTRREQMIECAEQMELLMGITNQERGKKGEVTSYDTRRSNKE